MKRSLFLTRQKFCSLEEYLESGTDVMNMLTNAMRAMTRIVRTKIVFSWRFMKIFE